MKETWEAVIHHKFKNVFAMHVLVRVTLYACFLLFFISQASYSKMSFTIILFERICGSSLGYWLCYSHGAHLIPQHCLPPALHSASSPNWRHFSSTLVNHSYLKARSTNWSFGKEYYFYPADVISLSQLALMDAAFAQGLVCSALGCNRRDSQMEN